MQCGPIRYKVDAKKQAKLRSFRHKVIVRATNFALPVDFPHNNFSIHDLYRAIFEDRSRNEMILQDVLSAVKEGKSPLILTERKAQVGWFAERLKGKVQHLVVLQGGMKAKEKKRAQEELIAAGDKGERVIVATGRLHREHLAKTEVKIYD